MPASAYAKSILAFLKEERFDTEGNDDIMIEVNHLNDGMYQAKLTDAATGFVWNSKLLIKKP